MSENFDPYKQWLGIEPGERPLNHYLLLGLNRFEDREDIIEASAEARIRNVRSYQTGPRGKYTQKLLNELAAARRCLLDQNTKATYDAVLQGQLAQQQAAGIAPTSIPAAPPPAVPMQPLPEPPPEPAIHEPPVAMDEPAPPPNPLSSSRASAISHAVRRRGRRNPGSALIVGSLILGGIAIAALLVWGAAGGSANSGKGGEKPSEVKHPQEKPPKERKDPPPPEAEIVVQQEGTDELHLTPATAVLSGTESESGESASIAGFNSENANASWRIRVARGGAFKVLLNYSADQEGPLFLTLDKKKYKKTVSPNSREVSLFVIVSPGESRVRISADPSLGLILRKVDFIPKSIRD